MTKFSSFALVPTASLALLLASGRAASSSPALRGRELQQTQTRGFDNGPISRIVGGDESVLGEYPYYVSVGGFCGGALIAPQVMLTAAHCTPGWNGNGVQVGAYKRGAEYYDYGENRNCAEVIDHPQYNDNTMDNDYALCKLDSPVTISEDRAVLVLNDEESVPAAGEDLVVMGLGTTSSGGNLAQTMRNVTVPTVGHDQCDDWLYGLINEDTMLCAGFEDGQKDSCQGDSGGPIVKRECDGDGKCEDVHVGVVSWGFGCAGVRQPGVYARTSHAVGWIKSVACDEWGLDAPFCDDVDDEVLIVTSSPTASPTESCKDEKDKFKVKGIKTKKKCTWAGKKPEKQCGKKLKTAVGDKKKVKHLCPKTCGEC